ncbi:MAG TPA: co-chaperone GroES [Candidatus Peribacterales bacterium]|nr:co-chaperone GroES [Candidatus Peribacterales bacterium]
MAPLPKLSLAIEPLGDHVAVIPDSMEQVTASGIVLPDTAKGEKSTIGTVIAVGKGGIGKDAVDPSKFLKVGDRVIFGKYSGEDIELKDEKGKDVEVKLLELSSVRALVR